jgi:CHRD domain
MTRRRLQPAAAVVLVLGLVVASIALASGGNKGHRKHSKGQFRAQLTGYEETPKTLNSDAHAKLKLKLTDTGGEFTLTYADLSGPPLFAHIHFGRPATTGGVSVFFCGGGNMPACPATASGTMTGAFTARDVLGPTDQGIDPGDLDSLVKAIRAGASYANMHTTKFMSGEIRGQIKGGHHGGHK